MPSDEVAKFNDPAFAASGLRDGAESLLRVIEDTLGLVETSVFKDQLQLVKQEPNFMDGVQLAKLALLQTARALVIQQLKADGRDALALLAESDRMTTAALSVQSVDPSQLKV